MAQKLVLCDCLGSQRIDAATLAQQTGLPCSQVYTNLCGSQITDAARELQAGDAIMACQQERLRFEELAAELGCEPAGFIDIRDRAGWGEGDVGPKMAALVAEATLPLPAGKTVDVVSEGTCLVIGGAAALEAASELADLLAVTVLLDQPDLLPLDRRFDCVLGTIRSATGALGGFELSFNDLRETRPGGRGAFTFGEPAAKAVSECDLILDLSGRPALFPAPHKREGYLRADPAHADAVTKAVLAASHMVGTFEKPLYVRLKPEICAHSRAEQVACSNCLDVCPTGAITPAGEHVAIDPMVCAGCGSCSAVCPSGAISYDAPPVETVFTRLQTLATAFRKAGGTHPRLLVHDGTFGREMIALAARFSRGLPAHVIPLEVDALSGFGHAEMLAALACGFSAVDILMAPKTELDVLEDQRTLATALAGQMAGQMTGQGQPIRLLHPTEPDALCDALYEAGLGEPACEPVLPLGSRRQVSRLAAKALQPQADIVPLPANAPYGTVVLDKNACTLCLSCVSLCPSGALGDNPDLPQLRFQEDACLQCGLCANICPENAITLDPRMNLTDAAFNQIVLHEEEPFACIECGSLFGSRSTVEKITQKLAGKHAMYATSQAAKMIQMCENCRIQAQYLSTNNPMQGRARPMVRTSDDYRAAREKS